MIRDELKDKEFFKKNIEEIQQLIKDGVQELKLGKIKKSQISAFSNFKFDLSIYILFQMYSTGYRKKEIAKYLPETIELFVSPYNDWECPKNKKYNWQVFHKILLLLSLAILVDASKEDVKKIIDTINICPRRYRILDYYLSYFDKSISIGVQVYQDEEPFKKLIDMFDKSNEEIESKKLMDKYLKDWYKSEERVLLRDTHNTGLDNYVGYWSFESAAFVKIKGLDDSSFRDNTFYPKDML